MPPPAQRATAPSLVNHLLNKWPEKLSKANQRPFLTHAGCGTLAASALSHWLGQNGHISRAMINFIGSLIGKVRLVDATNSKQNTQYRALDLLISTVSNLRKEIDFIESTKRRYNLNVESSPPIEMTKAYVDLLASTSDPRSTLLEGMVALWTTEHVRLCSSLSPH
jgi:thiaminase